MSRSKLTKTKLTKTKLTKTKPKAPQSRSTSARKSKSSASKRPGVAAIQSASWNPNKTSFERGRPYVELQLKTAGLDPDAQILTSKHPKVKKAISLLKTLNSPAGFEKWQLPFSFFHPTNLYVGVAQSGAEVPSHSHDEGAGMRFILEGSIILNGETLGPGDWAYIPRGMPYSLKVGARGARMLSDYAC